MTSSWAEWGPPLVVLLAGLLAGVVWALRLRVSPEEQVEATVTGHRDDLAATKAKTVEALRELELDADKLDPAEHAAQKRALLERGAGALRELETAPSAEVEASTPEEVRRQNLRVLIETVRAEHGDAAADRALAAIEGADLEPGPVLSPAWRGALWTLLGVALAAGLFWLASDNAFDRAPGATMTGNQPAGPSVAELQARLEADPNDVAALNALTQAALARRDLGTAMSLNSRARKADPDNADAQVHFSVLVFAIGESDRAFAILDEVIAKDPEHVGAWATKGLLALGAERPELAVEALEHAVALDPENPMLAARLEEARGGGGPITPAPVPTPAPAEGPLVVGGTITVDPGVSAAGQTLWVSVRDPAGGPPLAALRLPPGPFPLDFVVTPSNAIAMGGAPRPFPDVVSVSIRLDGDGDPMTRAEGEPSALLQGVARGTGDLAVTLR